MVELNGIMDCKLMLIFIKKKMEKYNKDDKTINNLTHKDIYPKEWNLKNGKDKFYVNIMNNSEKYLNQKFGRKWHLEKPFSLPKEKDILTKVK